MQVALDIEVTTRDLLDVPLHSMEPMAGKEPSPVRREAEDYPLRLGILGRQEDPPAVPEQLGGVVTAGDFGNSSGHRLGSPRGTYGG